jgi:hypothetical protein
MPQYVVLTGQQGDSVPLEQVIDNCCGVKRVGLREISYTAGWYNVSAALRNNTFRVRATPDSPSTLTTVPDGYYNICSLENVIQAVIPSFSATLNPTNGLVTISLVDVNYQINLASLGPIWGFADPADKWCGAGSYTADTTPNFLIHRMVFVHLDQINTTGSVINGRNSTLLGIVPISDESFGETRTVTFEKPQYRRLRDGSIQELTVRLLDSCGAIINMHRQPFTVTLEISNKHQ